MSAVAIPDLLTWLITTVLETFVAYLLIARGFAGRFFFLTSYLVSLIVESLGYYFFLQRYGLFSREYRLFAFCSDVLVTILMYFAIIELSVRIAGNKNERKRLVRLGLCVFFGTAWFSFLLMIQSYNSLILFAIELSRNLLFVSLLAVVLICLWIIYAGSADRIAARFAGVFGITLSLFAIADCFTKIAPSVHSLWNISVWGAAFLPIGFGMALFSRES